MINKQEYMNAYTQDITMVRGDSLIFGFELAGMQGDLPDVIKFKCTASYNEEPVFSAGTDDGGVVLENYNAETDTATYTVRIKPIQTEGLDVGRYYYDLAIKYEDTGDVYTLMRGNYDIVYEVKGAD